MFKSNSLKSFSARSGLTLLELLISLMLLLAISLALASSLSLGMKFLEKSKSPSEIADNLANRAVFRHWLSTAASSNVLTHLPTDFSGDSKKLTFTSFSATPSIPQAAAIKLTLDCGGQGIMVFWHALDDEGQDIKSGSLSLSGNEKSCEISYFSKHPDENGWRTVWEKNETLPSGVKITSARVDDEDWPEIVVSILHANE